MGREAVTALFNDPGELLHGLTNALGDAELGQMQLQIVDELSEHWPEIGPLFEEYRPDLGKLIAALLDLLRTSFLGDRSQIAVLFSSMVPLYPAEACSAILALLRDRNLLSRPWNILWRLKDSYPIFGPSLVNNPEMTEHVVRALLELLKADDSAAESIRPVAADLLEQIALAYPDCRQGIAAEIASLLPDWTFFSRDRDALVGLLQAVGLTIETPEEEPLAPPADGTESATESQLPPQLENLDHEELLPGTALPTLGDYCRFLRAMNETANPMEVMAAHGLTMEQYLQCVSAWGELISRRDDVAMRYGQLIAASSTSV